MRVNPMVWLHFQLAAGWRNLIILGALYIAVFFLGTSIVYRLNAAGMPFAAVAAGALGFVTGSQGLFLLILGPGAIHKSIQRDFQSGMMESHRITPMSGARIILGYLGGGYVQAGVLYAASLLMGVFYASQIGLPFAVSGWLVSQVCLWCIALVFAALGVTISLTSRGKVNVVMILIMTSIFGGWAVVSVVPGIGLLGGAMTGSVFWSMFRGGKLATSGDAAVAALTMAVQLCLAGTLLTATFRKVRFPERPLFPLPLAFLLLLVGGATLALGIDFQSSLDVFELRGRMDDLGAVQLVCSTIAFVVLAQFALLSAAFELFYVDRARAFGEPSRAGRRPALFVVPVVLTVAAVLLVELILMLLADQPGRVNYVSLATAMGDPMRHVAIGAALLTCFWIDFNLIYVAAARGNRPLRMMLVSALLLRVLPLLLDGIVMFVGGLQDEKEVRFVDGYFGGGSPIGTLILATARDGHPWPGLVFQIALAAAAGFVATRFRKRVGRRRERVAEAPALAAG